MPERTCVPAAVQLHAGAVGKGVATSAAIALTVLATSAGARRAPSLMEASLCASVLNAVLMYAVLT